VSTHSDMLSAAEKILGLSIDLARRFTKRRTPRELPKDFILEVLENRI